MFAAAAFAWALHALFEPMMIIFILFVGLTHGQCGMLVRILTSEEEKSEQEKWWPKDIRLLLYGYILKT